MLATRGAAVQTSRAHFPADLHAAAPPVRAPARMGRDGRVTQDMIHHHSVPLLAALALLAVRSQSQSPSVSPADRAQLEGSSYTHLPIGRANARMQTLHADLPGGTWIHGHAYRRDAVQVRGLVDGLQCELQVTLSLAPNLPTQASTTFANNVGPNPVTVLPRQFVTLPPTNRPGLDPAPAFELQIPYTTPFQLPPQGGTLCVDVEIFGNSSAAGSNRNLSIYLDAHENYSDGRAEQPGFRHGLGCPPPGGSSPAYATMTFWRHVAQTQIDVALRNGVAETGGNLARAWLALGGSPTATPWPTNTACTLWGSTDVWFVLPGAPDAQGAYDGSLTGLPLLPPGYRLWAQAGSAHLGTGALAFADGTTFVTPPPGPVPIRTCRVANSNDRTAATGTVAYAVPVMEFF